MPYNCASTLRTATLKASTPHRGSLLTMSLRKSYPGSGTSVCSKLGSSHPIQARMSGSYRALNESTPGSLRLNLVSLSIRAECRSDGVTVMKIGRP